MKEMPPVTSIGQLTRYLQKAWANLWPIVLFSLVASMLECMCQCIASREGYIGK